MRKAIVTVEISSNNYSAYLEQLSVCVSMEELLAVELILSHKKPIVFSNWLALEPLIRI